MTHTQIIWHNHSGMITIDGRAHKNVSLASLVRLSDLIDKYSYYEMFFNAASHHFVNRSQLR